MMRLCGEAGCVADGTANVFSLPAGPADEVMMVIADAVFKAGGRVSWLYPTNDALVGEDVQDIIDRLTGDRAEFRADIHGELIGGRMGMAGDGTQDGDTLGRDREVMLAQGVFGVSHLAGAKPRFGLCQKLPSLYFFGAALVAGGAVHSTGSLAAFSRSRIGA